ncbi:MAG: cytochrome c biogenesis protein CcdA [Rhodobacteraceae bacterium]|nr:cytochrome c biogenesis protein CcdA [Paracoccaceae bacterium]
MEFVFAFGAGLLTLINPCVLPVLPIVLASPVNAHKHGPLALAAGMSIVFVVLGMLVATLGSTVGLDADRVSQIGAGMMIVFGVVLLVPQLNMGFATATAGFAAGADRRMDTLESNGLRGQFVGGAILGAVWSPCVGPTLGGAIALAYKGEDLVFAAGIMTAFAMGISSIILLLGYGARETIRRRAGSMRALAERSKPIMGVIFLLVGLMIITKTHYKIESWLLEIMPIWLQDFSVSI